VRTPGEGIGIYQINQGSLGLISSNYIMTYVPGTFTILAPTAIDEIVNISVQGTNSLDDDKKKKFGYALLVADAGTSGGSDSQLPVCK
jgi:hypothetical protein